MRLMYLTTERGIDSFRGTLDQLASRLCVSRHILTTLFEFMIHKSWLARDRYDNYLFTRRFYDAFAKSAKPQHVAAALQIGSMVRGFLSLESNLAKKYPKKKWVANENATLRLAEQFLIGLLLFRSDMRGVVRGVGVAELADQSGLSRDTVARMVKALKSHHWIRYSVSGGVMKSPIRMQHSFYLLNLQHPLLGQDRVQVERMIFANLDGGSELGRNMGLRWDDALPNLTRAIKGPSKQSMISLASKEGKVLAKSVCHARFVRLCHVKPLFIRPLVTENLNFSLGEIVAWLLENHGEAIAAMSIEDMFVGWKIETFLEGILIDFSEAISLTEILSSVVRRLKTDIFFDLGEPAEVHLTGGAGANKEDSPISELPTKVDENAEQENGADDYLNQSEIQSVHNLTLYFAQYLLFMAKWVISRFKPSLVPTAKPSFLFLPVPLKNLYEMRIMEVYNFSSHKDLEASPQLLWNPSGWGTKFRKN